LTIQERSGGQGLANGQVAQAQIRFWLNSGDFGLSPQERGPLLLIRVRLSELLVGCCSLL
jgi:hypothetical protein